MAYWDQVKGDVTGKFIKITAAHTVIVCVEELVSAWCMDVEGSSVFDLPE